MLLVSMPKTFKVGNTDDAVINQMVVRLTWRDTKTLVIEPDDARVILHTVIENGFRFFMCTDQGVSPDKYTIREYPYRR
jgi:hypothetical protein